MFAHSKWSRYVLAAVTAVLLGFGDMGIQVSSAETFLMESFEDYPNGSIEGRGQTWEVTGNAGHVTTAMAHSGSKSMKVDSSYFGTTMAIWWDDLGLHGGAEPLDLSWYMYPTTVGGSWTWWLVNVVGWDGAPIAQICAQEVGSRSTIDCLSNGSWTETQAFVPTDQWTQVQMELDFSSDQYRVKAGAGSWSSWFATGNDETYLRRVEFCTYRSSWTGQQGYDYYVDDMEGSVVPEPSTALLLLGGVLGAGIFVRLRKRKGISPLRCE